MEVFLMEIGNDPHNGILGTATPHRDQLTDSGLWCFKAEGLSGRIIDDDIAKRIGLLDVRACQQFDLIQVEIIRIDIFSGHVYPYFAGIGHYTEIRAPVVIVERRMAKCNARYFRMLRQGALIDERIDIRSLV